MGTRSLTYVFDDNTPIACMYRQCDGYLEGHGAALAAFLTPITVVNGFHEPMKAGTHANGAGCLAAQMVAHFKKDIGGVYLVDPTQLDHGQEYEYRIFVHEDAVKVRVTAGWLEKRIVFDGTPTELQAWIAAGAPKPED